MRACLIRCQRALAIATGLIGLVAIGGCGKTLSTRSETLRETVIKPAPDVISVPEQSYVTIPARMTARCKWVADGGLEEMASVARGRKKCLEKYEAQLGEIEAVQGTPAPLAPELSGKP